MEASRGLDDAVKKRTAGNRPVMMETKIHLDEIPGGESVGEESKDLIPTDVDIEKWSAEGSMWKEYYRKLYHDKYEAATNGMAEAGQVVSAQLEKEKADDDDGPEEEDDFKKRIS